MVDMQSSGRVGVSTHSSVQINKPQEAIVQLASMILAGRGVSGYTTPVVQPVVY